MKDKNKKKSLSDKFWDWFEEHECGIVMTSVLTFIFLTWFIGFVFKAFIFSRFFK